MSTPSTISTMSTPPSQTPDTASPATALSDTGLPAAASAASASPATASPATAPPTTAPPTTAPPAAASRVWTALHEFVAGQDRRQALRAALGLGPGKVEVLIRLMEGPMTLREIARAVEIDPPAATVGVDKLEAMGLVHRFPHPDDNRRKLVSLTDAGRDAAQRGAAILSEPPPALAGLGPEDLARLEEIVTRLLSTAGPRARKQ